MAGSPNITPFHKKELNKVLSVKKKPLKSIRNILASKRTAHWPVVEDPTTVLNELKMFILEVSGQKLPHAEKTNSENDVSSKGNIKKHFVLGGKEVTKYLSKNECGVLLLDAQVPRILVNHLIHIAFTKEIPTACVAGLKNFIFSNIGFNGSTLCIKGPSEKCTKILNLISKNIQVNEPQNNNIVAPVENAPEPMEIETVVPTYHITYLYRNKKDVRIFNPPASQPSDVILSTTENVKECIKINTHKIHNSVANTCKNIKKMKFSPPIVNRVQNNVQRFKKKKNKKA